MLRLCSDSSRSYPGRSAPLCISHERRGAVMVGVMEQKSAKAIVGDWTLLPAIWQLETSRGRTPEDLPRRRAERRTGEEPNELL
jgi:hypothetical protein